MTIESTIDTALGSLVGGRIYPIRFPQPPQRPTWPAIRRTFVSHDRAVDLCGDGGDDAPDIRVQLDLVVGYEAGATALRTLRASVMTAMAAITPPAVLDSEFETFDDETRTNRVVMDYLIYPSSPP